MVSVHARVGHAVMDPTDHLEGRGHTRVVARPADVGHLRLPVFLVGQMTEPARRKGVGPSAINMPRDDAHKGCRNGIVHGGGHQGKPVAKAFCDHDLGGESGGLEGGVEGLGEDVKLARVPNSGFISGIPVGFVLGRKGVKGHAKMALDVLDVAHQVGGIIGIGGVSRTRRGARKGSGTVQSAVGTAAIHAVVSFISGGRAPFGTPDRDIGVDGLGQGHGGPFGVPGRPASGIRGINAGAQHGEARVAVDIVVSPEGLGIGGKIRRRVPGARGSVSADILVGNGCVNRGRTGPKDGRAKGKNESRKKIFYRHLHILEVILHPTGQDGLAKTIHSSAGSFPRNVFKQAYAAVSRRRTTASSHQ